jgi:hypothetical protein
VFNLKKIIHVNFVSIAISDSDGSAGNNMQEDGLFLGIYGLFKDLLLFLLFNYAV